MSAVNRPSIVTLTAFGATLTEQWTRVQAFLNCLRTRMHSLAGRKCEPQPDAQVDVGEWLRHVVVTVQVAG